jgi:thymidylate synthase (FAD)
MMKVINQRAEVIRPISPMKHIEKIGRICYKSEDKIAGGTDKKFVKMLYDNGHHAMLEHYRFILRVDLNIYEWLSKVSPKHVEFSSYNDRLLISFNARALLELHENCKGIQFGYLKSAVKNIRDELISHIVRMYDCYELFGLDREEPLPLLSFSVEFIQNNKNEMSDEEWNIHGWFSAHMVTDRGISHEIVRNREETSFAQESTRYCNYGKSGEITVIDQGFEQGSREWMCMKNTVRVAEDMYLEMISNGIKPQMARSVLPTCLKTEIVMTAPIYEWEHFFDLRMRGTTGAPHPMMEKLAIMVYDEYQEVLK